MSEEHALIERAVRGEADALDALAASHRPAVLRTALHLLGDADAAEDVAQETFVRLHAALPGFRGDAELSTWLYRVTLNLCRDHMRRRRRRAHDVPLREAHAAEALHVHERPEESVDGERARAAVRQAIARLPEEQREAVMLRFVSGLSYAEIARVTGSPQGTIASRVFRGLKRLGDDLEPRHLEVVK